METRPSCVIRMLAPSSRLAIARMGSFGRSRRTAARAAETAAVSPLRSSQAKPLVRLPSGKLPPPPPPPPGEAVQFAVAAGGGVPGEDAASGYPVVDSTAGGDGDVLILRPGLRPFEGEVS